MTPRYLIDLRCPDCGYVHRNASEETMRIWRDEGCPNGHSSETRCRKNLEDLRTRQRLESGPPEQWPVHPAPCDDCSDPAVCAEGAGCSVEIAAREATS